MAASFALSSSIRGYTPGTSKHCQPPRQERISMMVTLCCTGLAESGIISANEILGDRCTAAFTRHANCSGYVHLHMDATIKELLASLWDIRDKADAALRRSPTPIEQRSLALRCTACGHTKHFTRPALPEVAAPWPKCRGTEFQPI
jgi:hypothetical protein